MMGPAPRCVALAALALLNPGAALADLSYTYAEITGGIVMPDLEGADDGTVLGANGSYEIGDTYHVFGEYGRERFDVDLGPNDAELESSRANAGFGYHGAIAIAVDIIGEAGLVYVDGDGSDGELGFRTYAGLRAFLAGEAVELEGGARFVEIDGANDIVAVAAGRVLLRERFAIGAEGTLSDDSATLSATVYVSSSTAEGLEGHPSTTSVRRRVERLRSDRIACGPARPRSSSSCPRIRQNPDCRG